MSVRKLKENKITKDGRSWVFIQYSKGLDGKRHQYQSQAYITEEEAVQAEKIYLNNGTEAVVGYYDNSENWSDVSFYKLNHNIALINRGLEGTEAKEVLEFIKTINIE